MLQRHTHSHTQQPKHILLEDVNALTIQIEHKVGPLFFFLGLWFGLALMLCVFVYFFSLGLWRWFCAAFWIFCFPPFQNSVI